MINEDFMGGMRVLSDHLIVMLSRCYERTRITTFYAKST